MRRMVAAVVFLCIITIQGFALDPVQFEVISRFPNGDGAREFQFYEFEGMGSNPSSPEGLANIDGAFYISDNVNKRVVKIGDGEQAWEVLLEGLDPGLKLKRQGSFLFDFASSGFYSVYDLETQSIVTLNSRLSTGDSSYFRRTVIAGDMILVQPSSTDFVQRYYGFHIPEDFDGRIEMMSPDETIRYLKEDYDGTEEFAVDEDGYIFWNGRLVAPYGPSYFRYYYQTRENNPTVWNMLQSLRFTGWDDEGNAYWEYDSIVVVFNQAGEIIAQFLGENVSPLIRTQFAVTPEGTLYVLSYNRARDEFELMKLERFW